MAAPFLAGFATPNTSAALTLTTGDMTTAIPAGSSIIVLMGNGNTGSVGVTCSGVADTPGNTYTVYNLACAAADRSAMIAICLNSPHGLTTAQTVTATWSASTTGNVVVAGYTPTAGYTTTLDTHVGANGSSTAPSASTGTLAKQNETCYGCITNVNGGGIPSSPSWTSLKETHGSSQQYSSTYYYQPGTTTSSQTCSGTIASGAWGDAVLSTYDVAPTTVNLVKAALTAASYDLMPIVKPMLT